MCISEFNMFMFMINTLNVNPKFKNQRFSLIVSISKHFY